MSSATPPRCSEAATGPPIEASGQGAIEVENLQKRYDGKDVLKDVSFSVRRGEVLAILGPSLRSN